MLRMSTAPKIIITIFIIVILFVGAFYVKFMSLKVYDWNGNYLVANDGIKYQDSPALFKKYLNSEIKPEGIVGRVKGDKLLGFKTWVIKLKGYDSNVAFLIRGLMFEGVYVRQKE